MMTTPVHVASAATHPDGGVPLCAVRPRRRGSTLEDAILAAAYDELGEAGYTAFTVEGVAARARTGKASIYRRWPRRQELLLDALTAHLPTPAECGLQFELGPDVSTAQALLQVAGSITQVLASPAGQVMRAVACEAVDDPELAAAVDERFQAPRRSALVALLERGVQRGEVRPEAATPLVADVLPAMLMHRVLLQRRPVRPADVARIVEQVLLPLITAR